MKSRYRLLAFALTLTLATALVLYLRSEDAPLERCAVYIEDAGMIITGPDADERCDRVMRGLAPLGASRRAPAIDLQTICRLRRDDSTVEVVSAGRRATRSASRESRAASRNSRKDVSPPCPEPAHSDTTERNSAQLTAA
jgi:hypothetical protein